MLNREVYSFFLYRMNETDERGKEKKKKRRGRKEVEGKRRQKIKRKKHSGKKEVHIIQNQTFFDKSHENLSCPFLSPFFLSFLYFSVCLCLF